MNRARPFAPSFAALGLVALFGVGGALLACSPDKGEAKPNAGKAKPNDAKTPAQPAVTGTRAGEGAGPWSWTLPKGLSRARRFPPTTR